MYKVKKFLHTALTDTPLPFIQLLSAPLHPNPDARLTPTEALQSTFISPLFPVSVAAFIPSTYASVKTTSESIGRLREPSSASSSNHLTALLLDSSSRHSNRTYVVESRDFAWCSCFKHNTLLCVTLVAISNRAEFTLPPLKTIND
jgi:hypothetical protein